MLLGGLPIFKSSFTAMVYVKFGRQKSDLWALGKRRILKVRTIKTVDYVNIELILCK